MKSSAVYSCMPMPMSAVVLTLDAAVTLERCLSSLADFAEVLVYDNGSTDATLEIAARFPNVRIVKGHFDGFGTTRNRAAREARHDWIFNIDSDEWLTPPLRESLRGASLRDPKLIHTFTRRNLMFGHVPRSILGRELIHRLYHRDHVGWEGKVHENIVRLDGAPLLTNKLRGELWHDPYSSVGHLFHKRWVYAQPALRNRLKPQHPALAVLRALWRFLRSYVIQIGFIDGWRGFVISAADAYGVFLKYVWAYDERERNSKKMELDPRLRGDDEKMVKRIRIVHFVTGGGTGATRVALDLALAQSQMPGYEPHLILRNKNRPLSAVMQEQIKQAGLPLLWVDNVWPRWRVIRQLVELCTRITPDVFFAHGYSEHLWGRHAAFASRVPVVIQVEHNVERYLPWRVWAARRLAGRTQATACVSQAVADNVHRLQIGGQRVEVLHNGVDLQRFHCDTPLSQRNKDILMPARFARKKDQPTLIRAVKLLADRGWQGQLLLAGGGKPVHRRRCERLVKALGLGERVQFLGNINDLPQRLANCRIAALATWQEGLPLVLAEAMAAGCTVVASGIPGVTDILKDGSNGWTFPAGDAPAAADALWQALNDDAEAQRRADAGRADANGHFSLNQMAQRYDNLLRDLLWKKSDQA